ncbi:MAG: hypothetical protein OEY67_05360 [Gammaproteobacteria bacterium]|nr:hypothetical protein [Gammaproteobacteria bacterium]
MIIDAREKFLKRAQTVERTVQVMSAGKRQSNGDPAGSSLDTFDVGHRPSQMIPSEFTLEVGREWFKESHDQIVLNGENLATEFYRRMFLPIWWRSPQFFQLLVSGRDKFLHALIATLHDPENPAILGTMLSELWIKYRVFGALPSDYREMPSILLSVMRNVIGDKWSDETDAIWCEVLKADNVFTMADVTSCEPG